MAPNPDSETFLANETAGLIAPFDNKEGGAADGQREGVNSARFTAAAAEALAAFARNHENVVLGDDAAVRELLVDFFRDQQVKSLLREISFLKVFSHDLHHAFDTDLEILAGLKTLKYFFNVPLGAFFVALEALYATTPLTAWWAAAKGAILSSDLNGVKVKEFLKANADLFATEYVGLYTQLEAEDPHAVYPTNIYRQCDGTTVSTADRGTIESVMSTTLTTTIKIRKNVLVPANSTLSAVYKPLGRCVAIIDDKVEGIYGSELSNYFSSHDVKLTKLVYKGNEVDKEIDNVEKILVDLKKVGVARNEPVLIVGGGVIADIGGFACGLYHRSTPYVMLCTSIVSGIDAGPSPRTCCDGFGYKNLYGAYHPPILTITDRYFFKSLHEGWLRHGIAEIIKMSVTKDYELFTLLEKVGPRLIRTKFGTTKDTNSSSSDAASDAAFEADCDLIVGRALDSYVKSEYGNLWETHQCRPHAYGHTWSPGYELSSGMLHGHAVATGMGFGAFLARQRDWISEADYRRVLQLISDMELALWHPVMDEVDMIWGSQVKMVQKRGGNLCAPLPRGSLGVCGYLNDLSYDELRDSLAAYKQVCATYPRNGLGVDVHCSDVGLGDPSVTARSHVKNETNGVIMEVTEKTEEKTGLSYSEWIKSVQTERNADWKFNVTFETAKDTAEPPAFEHVTLFHAGAEQYAMDMTSVPSKDVQNVARATMDQDMFAPCMVGTLESQFLKLQTSLTGAKSCLDIGTFTGMSAVAMAEGVPADGKVVTLEFDDKIADAAQANFDAATVGRKITMMRGSAVESMRTLKARGEKFDIVFLDADKAQYIEYYDLAMDGLLSENGFIMADNSLCAILYDDEDSRSRVLHRFNQHVKNDPRVEQVILTMREGVTIIKPIKN